MDRAREWGLRIQHEASLHAENSFLTLTYRDVDLPHDYSVSVRELQLFFKRLRERIAPARLRFYACGEYGDGAGRPHYHAIVFGYGFPDKTVWRKAPSGFLTYRSAVLESVWPFGHSEVGSVTRESGAYVARYVLKKIGGAVAEGHYKRVHPVTGVVCQVEPEFATMSSRPGIGSGWFDANSGDCYPSGYLVYNGKKMNVPRYYRDKVEERFDVGGDLRPLRRKAQQFQREHKEDLTDERLAARGELQAIKQAKFKRDLGET